MPRSEYSDSFDLLHGQSCPNKVWLGGLVSPALLALAVRLGLAKLLPFQQVTSPIGSRQREEGDFAMTLTPWVEETEFKLFVNSEELCAYCT